MALTSSSMALTCSRETTLPQGMPSSRQQLSVSPRRLSVSPAKLGRSSRSSSSSSRSSIRRAMTVAAGSKQGPAPLGQEDEGESAGATWQQERIQEGVSAVLRVAAAAALSGILTFSTVGPSSARLEGVNKPELLPKEFTQVIDTGGFLSTGQMRRLADDIARLERDTGYKLRVLSQSYPNTPGLAIREYWGVDDDTIVFVADPTFRNILNFNVGAGVDLKVPRSFWTRLAGKYGTMFYWKEQGEDAAIEAAVLAIDACLREEPGPRQCADIR